MLIKAIKCKKCNDVIFSRANHDMHYCGCGQIAIDGGLSYTRIVYNGLEDAEPWEGYDLELDISEKELYDDWAKGKDKYGLIKDVR